MGETPNDILEVARRCWIGAGEFVNIEGIAQAIFAERQRCAGLTDKYRQHPIGSEARLVAAYLNLEILNP